MHCLLGTLYPPDVVGGSGRFLSFRGSRLVGLIPRSPRKSFLPHFTTFYHIPNNNSCLQILANPKIDSDFSDSGAQDSWLTPFSLRILNGITTMIGNLDSTIGKGLQKWRSGGVVRMW